jgi:hypothetical protein
MVLPRLEARPTRSSILHIEPRDTAPWYGEVLSKGNGDDRFWATRDPDVFCALIGGSLYWIDVRDPASVVGQRPGATGDHRVIFARSLDLLLVCGTVSIEGYRRDGLHWRTNRLAFDEILEIVIDGDVLRGVATTYPDGSLPFAVDLLTGDHEGGFPGWEALGARRIE